MSEMIEAIDERLIKAMLPKRPVKSHKGTFGSALLIAGSRHYTGAAQLAGSACLRSGVGLVFMGIPDCIHIQLSAAIPEAIWEVLPSEGGALNQDAAKHIPNLLQGKSAWMLGSGIGRLPPTKGFILQLFQHDRQWIPPEIPLLLDADALHLISEIPDGFSKLPTNTVLTPHYKEMSQMTGLRVEEIGANPTSVAASYASRWQSVLVLKSSSTVVASPDGRIRLLERPTSSLAHGGTGDVLAGLITGLLAQGIGPFTAATLGVFVHNQAARLAEQVVGWAGSVLAGDLLTQIGRAFGSMEQL